ncbi:hypothetical protein [Pseudomonas syringae]|uniref:hypothetical protein n=1 Tax=Pseudomonas syringae TaxID=317 RepID=UPI001CA8C61D|nr:hypothetical protein [Pseudomonas syringae]
MISDLAYASTPLVGVGMAKARWWQDAVGQANSAVDAALSMARGETLAPPVTWGLLRLITRKITRRLNKSI